MPSIRRLLLVAILVLAAFLRLAWLDAADVISDEALYGFRSIGYVDYLAAPDQPTTWERLSWPVPWWAYLSFHDHPPATFILQHASFQLLGVSALALRLPSALAGIASVVLAYLVSRRLWGERAGVLAALLFAVTTPLVWVSRLGLQESLVILWSMLAVYGYVRGGGAGSGKQEAGDRAHPLTRSVADHPLPRGRGVGGEGEVNRPNHSHTSYSILPTTHHWYLLVGLALGLGLLTKYTSLAVTLALLIHLLWFRRSHLRSPMLWWGGGLLVLCSAPIVVYNAMLYSATGHFDLQLSFLLGQNVAEWRSLPGKAQIGSLGQRLTNFISNLGGSLSILLLLGVVVSVVAAIWRWWRYRDERDALVVLLTVMLTALLLALGASTRFLVPLLAWMLLAVVSGWASLKHGFQRLVVGAVLAAAVLWEFVFAVNTVLPLRPSGATNVAYSAVLRTDMEHWGYRELDIYLERTLTGQRPALQPDMQLPFLKVLQTLATQKASARGDALLPILIVYDQNLYDLGALWTLHRRLIYDGWPVVTADRYLSQPASAWRSAGVQEVLFIQLADGMLGEEASRQTEAAKRLAAESALSSAKIEVLKSEKLSAPAFTIRRWSTQ